MAQDARIPVIILATAGALAAALQQPGAQAILTEAGGVETGVPLGVPLRRIGGGQKRHFAGCACCAGRPAIAVALDQLFQDRTRGRCAWFDSVLVLAPQPATRAELETALREDALTIARFRAGR